MLLSGAVRRSRCWRNTALTSMRVRPHLRAICSSAGWFTCAEHAASVHACDDEQALCRAGRGKLRVRGPPNEWETARQILLSVVCCGACDAVACCVLWLSAPRCATRRVHQGLHPTPPCRRYPVLSISHVNVFDVLLFGLGLRPRPLSGTGWGSLETVRTLISLGANVTAKTPLGNPPCSPSGHHESELSHLPHDRVQWVGGSDWFQGGVRWIEESEWCQGGVQRAE
eukprot:1040474-Rhodomonas_salina.3